MRQKLLIVGPCLAMGGIERASVNTANAFQEKGIEVIFVSLFNKPHFFELNTGIELEEPISFNGNKLSLLKSILWLRKLLKTHKPDSVLAFNKFYGAITALGMVGNNTPLFISERSSPLFVWKQPIKTINWLAYRLKSPTGVLAQTSIAAEYQKRYFKKSRIQVIPNMLREVKTYPHVERKKVVLAVGRLGDYLKGFDLLLESFALVKDKSWELHIAGGDENGQELKALASNLGVKKRIKFLGKVKEIDRIYAYASVFVIPSRSEGFPNALVEAMAAGCSCIAFNFVAGPKDIIENNKSGLLIESGDLVALARSIDYLIANPIVRQDLGKNAKEIRKVLNKDEIVNRIMDFLNLHI